MHYNDIIISPVITEKAANVSSDGKTYVFKCNKDANKFQIKNAIEEARQIDLVADMLGNELGMRVTKFTSEEDAEDVALVQGIIDLVYEGDDGWVVVDYKTDRYSEKEAKTKEERADLARSKHAFQLDSYSAAYEAAGRKVSKKYLYLVRYGEFVEV